MSARPSPQLAAIGAARRVVAGHLAASDYRDCVEAAALLHTPARLHDAVDLWNLSAVVIAASFGLLDQARTEEAELRAQAALAGEADLALDGADAESVLVWCTAAGEWCERNGLDEAFARLSARAAEADPAAPAWIRVHWRIADAWHHESFGRFGGVAYRLAAAGEIAAAAADPGLAIVVALKQARLALARATPSQALAQADEVEAGIAPGAALLWRADIADVRARAALAQGRFTVALHQSRLCLGLAQQAGATPAYTVTYRLNEAYALLGLGATDEAVTLVQRLAAVAMPVHIQQRTELLATLFALARDDRGGRWGAVQRQTLVGAVRRLRELEWTGALVLLPEVVARLWARALEADIETDWVRTVIRARSLPPPEPAWPEAWPWPIRLRVLGAFEVESLTTTELAGSVRAASKPVELLLRLAVEAGLAPMSAEVLATALWPGEGRAGRDKALETTLARLRRLLGDAGALRMAGRRLRFDPQRVWLDRSAVERLLDVIDARVGNDTAAPDVTPMWQEVLRLWRGPLLADAGSDDAVPPWLRTERTRLRQRLATSLIRSHAVAGERARRLHAIAADPGLAEWLPHAGTTAVSPHR